MYLINIYFSSKTPTFYTYHSDVKIEIGSIVLVELRKSISVGVVIGYEEKVDFQTKPVLFQTKYKVKQNFLDWIFKVSEYYLITTSDLLNLCLIEKDYKKAELKSFYLKHEEMFSVSELLRRYGKRSFLSRVKSGELIPIDFDYQSKTFQDLHRSIIQNLNPTLIYGTTGSGKTEIYLNEIKNTLSQNKQVLLLLPEILLGEYFSEKIFSHLGFWPHLWNHKTHALAKSTIWEWAISGEPGLLVGSRSSIWIPLNNLGLIIVDEEHDYSYKQENYPIHNARDIAILRSSYEAVPCLLVSATPSLETWNKVLQNKYNKFEIDKKQIVSGKFIELKSSKYLSDELIEYVISTLKRKEQCLLFLNKKGFSSLIICAECSNILQCDYCSVNVTFYKNNLCQCGQCQNRRELDQCKKCGSNNWNLDGIGIEQIQEMLNKRFKDYKIISISTENVNSMDYLSLIYKGEIDIIVSTQVLAKGYTFPKLTLVAVLEGDRNLLKTDPRGNEKIYQLLTQVRGRCGRVDLPGTFIIQNHSKNLELIQDVFDSDYPVWAKKELEQRKIMNLPPMKQIIRFIIRSKDPEVARNIADDLFILLKSIPRVQILPPAKALIYKIRNQYRYSILMQNDVMIYPQRRIKALLSKFKEKNKVIVDVDPYNFS